MNNNHVFLNSIAEVSDELFLELQQIARFREIEAGTQIVRLGEIPSKMYMLRSGVIRCYLSTESGKEFNKSFYLPISFVASLTALIKGTPSLFVFETITNCKLYEMDYRKFTILCGKNHKLNELYSKALEKVYMKYESRLVELISLNAKDRYLKLIGQIPEINDLIPQFHIASYLGITPVQLSRIRKKLGHN
ncbi:Crp/Fnr family transcriptional regulator [Yeosuana sp. MJ-SS3]|uniref:Crp/Fnr family transcriptional regulator n=1 Tax=Gilvirhabdus luticola TaxID=3079858 RepID=A0ABU3U7A3_9FLAO|nr:Crp/Fnr family transcriptional regulator [Yeosuana sp. MJ-SS3]MDU8886197.1 Crp/Fnr family transcriptional regulator [Yeosuana sp. MJ-SS3]